MRALVFASLLAASSASFAGGYVGFGAGTGHVSDDCAKLIHCDKSDSAYKVYGGLNILPWLSAELTWFDWGSVDGSEHVVGNTDSEEYTDTLDAKYHARVRGVGLGLAAKYNCTPKFAVTGRVGLAANHVSYDASLDDGYAVATFADSHHSTKPYIGADVSYAFTKHIAGVLGFDVSRAVYANATHNVHMATVGLKISF